MRRIHDGPLQALSGIILHLRLIRLAAGKRVPRHTHEGHELTVVIEGGFRDEQGHHLRGDLVIGIDSSTTATKAIAWDRRGRAVAEGRAAVPLSNPRPGWFEQKAEDWTKALTASLRQLARKIVLDGEGVSRFVEVQVCGAAGKRDAMMAAESIARSMLVKCAWFGGDPNWGRVLAAVGYSGARVREELVDIHYDGLLAVKGGLAGPVPVAKLKRVVRKPSFRVSVNLHLGQGQHTVYTTDLTEEYVRFNKSE